MTRSKKSLKQYVIISIMILCAAISIAAIAYMLWTPAKEDYTTTIHRPEEPGQDEYKPKQVRSVSAVIRDDDLGYAFRATEVVVAPFEDAKSVTSSDKEVVLVKYIVEAAVDGVESPVSGDIILVNAKGVEVSPSTSLVDGRMKENGYTPGATAIGAGEIRSGYEAYFVDVSSASSLKIKYVRPADKNLPKKEFITRLYP